MIRENLNPRGELHILVRDKDGNITVDRRETNLVVTEGLNYIAAKMADSDGSTKVMSHMAVGTDNTGPVAGNTALGAQLGTRVAFDSVSVTANAVEYVATFPSGGSTHSGALVEAGIFDSAAAADEMLCRTTFATINKGDDDTVTITWTVSITAP